MKSKISESSFSLITDLCRELDIIRQRGKNVVGSIKSSKNKDLRHRLLEELANMNSRRQEIQRIVLEIKERKIADSFSTNFLIELCNRDLNNDWTRLV